MMRQRLQQIGSAKLIGFNVSRDIVHALADANRGGEMHNAVDSTQRIRQIIKVANIADQKFDVIIEMRRTTAPGAVDLR